MLKKITDSKFNIDLLWNFSSFALIAVLGVLVNVVIAKTYGNEGLGVFNQVYAIYLILSQLAVGGVHLAVQRYIPIYSNRVQERSTILFSSLLISGILSIIIISLAYTFYWLPGKLLHSNSVQESYQLTMFGLLFFSFNKVLISFHNGLRNMKAFAIFQLLRYVFLMAGILLVVYLNLGIIYLASSLAISEVFLFIICFLYSLKFLSFNLNFSHFNRWNKINFKFGNKALAGNFLLDINTKVDVFVIGIFFSDALVGIYSFASTFAEGFMLLPVLVRNNLNPVLAKLKTKSNKQFVSKILKISIRKSFKFIGFFALLGILFFPLVFFIFDINENRFISWSIFSTLVLCMGISGGYQPLLMMLNQFGKPMQQTYLIILLFTSNLVLNLALVPLLGIAGSAVATGSVFILQIFLQKYFAKKYLYLSI
jgi:O-antigen/teichoic acid export membrane protein